MSDTRAREASADTARCPVGHGVVDDGAQPHEAVAAAQPERCPVDHEAVAAARAAGCPVDHRVVDDGAQPHDAMAATVNRPTSTCAYAPGNAKRGYLVPGLIAFAFLLVVGAILNVTDFSHSSGDRLQGPLVANQIASAYQTSRSGAATPTVRCPTSEPVAAGRVFTCQLVVGGATRAITVTESGGGQFAFTGLTSGS